MKHPVGLPRYYGSNRKSISNKTREAVYAKLAANGNVCGLCSRPIEASDKVHLDHILPVHRGGTDDPSNLQGVHEKCNLSKGSCTPEQKCTVVRLSLSWIDLNDIAAALDSRSKS